MMFAHNTVLRAYISCHSKYVRIEVQLIRQSSALYHMKILEGAEVIGIQ